MFTLNSPIWGIVSYIVFGAIVFVPLFWPRELGLVLDQFFWLGLFLFAYCVAIIFYLFWSRGGSSRNSRFSFGLILIIAAAAMNSGFEQIAKNGEFWSTHFPNSYLSFFIWLKILVTYARDVVAFGIAALGANIAAHAIMEQNNGESPHA